MKIVITLSLLAACVACAPFNRGTFDNRPDDRTEVVSVSDTGVIELKTKERVRIFGIQPPKNPERRDAFLKSLREHVTRGEVSTEVILDEEPPAVSMLVWRPGFICGIGLQTWNPGASPLPTHGASPVAGQFAIWFEGALNEDDLSNPDIDPALAQRLRDSHDYGIEYRAGRAK